MMPYINKEARNELSADGRSIATDYVLAALALNAGELNFQLTEKCLEYLSGVYNYEKLNAVMGALECCKLEMYRRMVVPYEDKKIKENGDVYPNV
jgi:hypothetical protein